MDGRDVRELEAAISEGIARVLEERGMKAVSEREVHLMAKAAVAVLEAVMQGRGRGTGSS